MFDVAVKMLLQSRLRCLATVLGIAALFFLSAAQLGLLVGWCNTTSAIVRHTDADLWVMAPRTTAFDYGTPIPEFRVQQVQNVAGVETAESMFLGWTIWQCPDGRRLNVELVGLDDSCNGAPWKMKSGRSTDVLRPQSVIVDELFLDSLGVSGLEDEAEMAGRRAIVRGVSRDVRSFTAAPFVFTSVTAARQFSPHYSPDEITYVLVKCQSGVEMQIVRDRIEAEVPHVECLTKQQFVTRTVGYWMLETGAGLTVICTAVLGGVVSVVVTSQTLYSITQDHLKQYATLLAVGFERWKLISTVALQSLLIATAAALISTVVYLCVTHVTADSPVRMETTLTIYSLMLLGCVGGCIAGSVFSIRTILNIDPAQVFRS